MKRSQKESSKGLGMFFSIALHVGVVVLILYWGFSGTSQYSSTPGHIQVSLSGLETGGEGNPNQPPAVKKPAVKPKPPEPEKVQKKEEVEPPPPPPEKKEEVKEEKPKEKEKPKEEVVKKEPEKKEVIPLETKKEEKKEAAQKPKPTPKPKVTPKPKPKPTKKPVKKKDFEKEKDRILKDIQRQKILDNLKKDKSETKEPPEQIEEEIGEERRLAMADDLKTGGEPETEENFARSSSGGSSISPIIIQLYVSQVHRKISRNWRIPPGVPTDGSLAASISFKVDGSGRVNNVRVLESSGNSSFDEYCVNTINRSAPFPPPPYELAEEAKNKGLELTCRNDP
jgi:colicin import membrane protein